MIFKASLNGNTFDAQLDTPNEHLAAMFKMWIDAQRTLAEALISVDEAQRSLTAGRNELSSAINKETVDDKDGRPQGEAPVPEG